MPRHKYTDSELIDVVSKSKSIRSCLTKLGLVPAGGNYVYIRRKVRDLNLDTSHFTGSRWNVGQKFGHKKEIHEYLILSEQYVAVIPSNDLKKRLLFANLKTHKCEQCHESEWQTQKIPLELHHVNGNRYDNRIDNLQLLCPNCHALTKNYRGKNRKKGSNPISGI